MPRPAAHKDRFGNDVPYTTRNTLAWILTTSQLPSGGAMPHLTLHYNFDVENMCFRLIPESVLLAKSSRLYRAVVYLRHMGFEVCDEQFRGVRMVQMIRNDGREAFATKGGYVYITDDSGYYRIGNNGDRFENLWVNEDDGEIFRGSPKISS